MKIEKIQKRDGSIVRFEPTKIAAAVFKALSSLSRGDARLARTLAQEIVTEAEKRFSGRIPTVEEVQDTVEEVLIKRGFPEVAKSYIIYRHSRSEMREAKKVIGVADDLKLSVNAVQVLKRRYLLRDGDGNVLETPAQMFRRVAKAVSEPERHSRSAKRPVLEEEFFRCMAGLEFLPNSPTLMNAGTQIGQLSACFVLPVEDSLEGIFQALKEMALVHQSGGGTGFSFSRLRPSGDCVRSTGGVASGPVSFVKVFDAATQVVKQGGRRRGANMAVLSASHPDILEFISSKSKDDVLANFNLSVAVTDEFMDAVEKGLDYRLVNPRNGKTARELPARTIFDMIVSMAWRTGDPGLLFIDEINRHNPTPEAGSIEATNPCGEQPLLPYESCNLGSLNLSEMISEGRPEWEKLRGLVHTGVRFLDDVIDANRYPTDKIEKTARANRKIGLGVMGFAEALIKMGIPYNSAEAVAFAGKIMKFIRDESRAMSQQIAEEKGSFPNFPGSVWRKKDYRRMRNASLNAIAPTGSISIIAGCSSGIEPLFAVSYARSVMEGAKLLEAEYLFEDMARKKGFYSRELIAEIARKGNVRDIKGVPEDVQKLFATALDIEPEWHLRIQAAFQRYVDSAVSKTVNLRAEAGPDEIRDIFLAAYKLKCKGITVYRYGSKSKQVLYTGISREDGGPDQYVSADPEYSGGCPGEGCSF